MAPFQPKGDRSLRIIAAELVASGQPGDMLTYEQLGEALGLDPMHRRDQIRQAVSAARNVLLIDHKRTVVAVRGEGYRIALANEFAGIAQNHRQRADRQIAKAYDVVTHVNEAELSREELERHRAVALVISNLHTRLTGAETRLENLEAAVFGPRNTVPGDVVG